ncbi:MAG: putative lipid II flippase FtsW [Acidobacteriota bacterium]
MNRKIPYDQTLILVVLSLVGFGLVMVFSASATVSQDLYGSPSSIFLRQMLATLLGLLGLLAAMKIDYQSFSNRYVIYPLLALAVGLLVLPHLMSDGEVARWIRVGPMQFQPSEFAKLAAILFSAYYLSRSKTDLGSFSRGVLPSLGVTVLLAALVLAGRDLGTAACIALVFGLMLFLAGLPYRHIPILALGGAAAFGALVLAEPYRMQRIINYLNPGSDPSGAGYQIRQSLIALGSGGLGGMGLADSKQKLYFLPEPHTDFIFAVIGEELGLMGCLFLIGLFALFLWRGLSIALKADSRFGTYLGIGIVAMVVLQALINMSVVVQLLPTKGIPLPFISVGGSSMMVMLTACGILLNISKHTRMGEAEEQ